MRRPGSAKIHIGTSGWSYSDWVGPFYPRGTPPGDYLASYGQRFSTVEVDSSFYAVPGARMFERWAAHTPQGFRFALKVPGTVTHGREVRGAKGGSGVRVEKVGDEYVLSLPELERIVPGAGVSPSELRWQLHNQLVRLGAMKALEKAGVKPGDRIRCGELEWEW